jgi:hypothetical protein
MGCCCALSLRVWWVFVLYWMGTGVFLCLGIVGLGGFCCVLDMNWGVKGLGGVCWLMGWNWDFGVWGILCVLDRN